MTGVQTCALPIWLVGYIPFARFGDFVVEFADPDTNERTVMQFDSENDRREFIKQELDANKIEYTTHKRLDDVSYSRRTAAPSALVTKVLEAMKLNGATQDQLDSVYQLQLSLMPSTSIAKRFMHRKGVSGMSEDLVRGFANTQSQWIRRLVATKYNDKILSQIDTVKNLSERNPDELIHAAAESVLSRSDYILNPSNAKLTNFATSASYYMYIWGNMSTAFMNVCSLPGMVYPKLGAVPDPNIP